MGRQLPDGGGFSGSVNAHNQDHAGLILFQRNTQFIVFEHFPEKPQHQFSDIGFVQQELLARLLFDLVQYQFRHRCPQIGFV
jgi:hypothetical protein